MKIASILIALAFTAGLPAKPIMDILGAFSEYHNGTVVTVQ